MDTTNRNRVQPLAFIISVIHIILALFALFSLVASITYLCDVSFRLGSYFYTTNRIINLITRVLLLLWFIWMKGKIGNGVRTCAIIGLSILFVLDILATGIDICYAAGEMLSFFQMYYISSSVFNLVGSILIGFAFIAMRGQFKKKIGAWAFVNGLLGLLIAFLYLIFFAFNILGISYSYTVFHIQKLAATVLVLLHLITTIIFFRIFATDEDATSIS